MEITDQVQTIIEPALLDMGYEIVRIALIGGDIKTLQIMAERSDRQDMTVDDCEKISRTASALLDITDPFPYRWILEVSSPGIDRPLVKPADYERFKGHEAKIELAQEINGRRRFKGIIQGIKDNIVFLNFEGETISFAFDDIQKAKLTFQDATLDNKGEK
ncbi:MAG: ribosome maturation factor RimP [Alphaproteobacteria bacterium]|nr:ribosome maturation factor RimP [Alphaproteobacteria bacterium]